MVTERRADDVARLPDEEERQAAALERLFTEKGLGRHGTFWEVGEGTFLPDGTEDLSGFVVDERGRIFFFWTGWDAERGEVAFETWRPVEPEPDWERDPEHRRARAAVRLPE